MSDQTPTRLIQSMWPKEVGNDTHPIHPDPAEAAMSDQTQREDCGGDCGLCLRCQDRERQEYERYYDASQEAAQERFAAQQRTADE